MTNFKEIFTFTELELSIKIERVVDVKYPKDFKLIAIQNSAYFEFARRMIENDVLVLPKFYAGLVYLTGESDERYDDYKGSYSFMFKLEVKKHEKISEYFYHIYHYRSYIEFSVHQLISENDPRESRIYHQPNDELFSDRDICGFSIAFYKDVVEHMELTNYTPEPFVKYSDSNSLLFGYLKDEYFFKEEYENQDVYFKDKEALQEEVDIEQDKILAEQLNDNPAVE